MNCIIFSKIWKRMFLTSLHCNDKNVSGLLVVVDYSKAFDTITWSFVDQCLKLFNFGDQLIEWIKILRKNSIARVEQNGQFKGNIHFSRGCRQGDPISLYIFVLCTEIFSHVIREMSDVRGIKVFDEGVKQSQNADDTIVYLHADKESLSGVMQVLDWFKIIYGLGINKEKTKVIKIRPFRDKCKDWEGKFGQTWS